MGTYLNPGNSGFSRIRNDIYVDKSGLIGLVNQVNPENKEYRCIVHTCRIEKI